MAYGTLSAIADAAKLFAIDLISGSIFTRTKMAFGAEGSATDVSAANPLPVTVISGVTTGLTDTQLRAAALPLPTGAATSAAQTTGNASLASIDTKLSGPVPITTRGNGVTYTDRSGTVTAGGTQQQLAAANANRVGLMVQNTSAGDLRVSSRGNASATAGILIKTGDLFIWPVHGTPVVAISIFGATTGQAFEAMEW